MNALWGVLGAAIGAFATFLAPIYYSEFIAPARFEVSILPAAPFTVLNDDGSPFDMRQCAEPEIHTLEIKLQRGSVPISDSTGLLGYHFYAFKTERNLNTQHPRRELLRSSDLTSILSVKRTSWFDGTPDIKELAFYLRITGNCGAGIQTDGFLKIGSIRLDIDSTFFSFENQEALWLQDLDNNKNEIFKLAIPITIKVSHR